MKLEELFKRDLGAVCADIGTMCIVKGRNGSASVCAVISDEQTGDAGYALLDGRTVNATAQFDASKVRFPVRIGDSFLVGKTTYRVTNITRTVGDPSITLSLSVEGKR